MGFYFHLSCSKNEARFMIVGNEKDRHYELISFASDEFTAHRIRKIIIESGGDAEVMPFSELNLKKVEDRIESEFQKSR